MYNQIAAYIYSVVLSNVAIVSPSLQQLLNIQILTQF